MKTMASEKMEVLVAVPSLDSTAGGFVLAASQQTARQQDCKIACKVLSARAVADAMAPE